MDLRNIQAASAAGGGLHVDRQGGRLAEERNISDIAGQAQTAFVDPQDQINFSQDALRGSVIAAEVQRGATTGAADTRNTRSAFEQGAVKASAEAGAITSGGAKQTERPPAPEGLSLEKLAGDLTYEYADINGAHSAITSPLQSIDSGRNNINTSAGEKDTVRETAEIDDAGGISSLLADDADKEGDGLVLEVSPLLNAVPPSRLAASAAALPGTILDINS